MENLIQTTTKLAMHIAGAYVRPESLVIDATCGNGGDTLQLAAMNPARPIAFDREPEAVRITREKLTAHGYAKAMQDGHITAICLPHERMAEYFKSSGAAFLVLANKLDKLKKSEIEPNLRLIRETLGLDDAVRLIPFSAESGAGREELLQAIFQE